MQVLIKPYCNELAINGEIHVYAFLKHSNFSFPVGDIYIYAFL